ncbi:hypothetical protein N9045_00790 [bacterium]|nr:hypothetical protein [bacterium]
MTIGIVTAFNNKFYQDFKFFVRSLRKYTNIPLYAYPIDEPTSENTPNLKELIKDDFKSISDSSYAKISIPSEMLDDLLKIDNERWIQWHKAKLIKHVAEELRLTKVLWIDSDIVVLDNICPIFDHIDERLFVTKDYFAPLTCKNSDALYDKFTNARVSPEEENIVLNSGVVGFNLPRDKPILNSWIAKTQLIEQDPSIKDLISLYDQGTLLWTLRDMKRLDLISDLPHFNHNAKRNAYERDDSTKWPGEELGGNIFDQIKIDNPNVILCHYAGLPKLSNLLHFNHHTSIVHNKHKYKNNKFTKLVGVGLERAGTHSLATMLRKSCMQNSWIRHEFSSLGKAAYDKLTLGEYNKLDLQRAIQRLDRTDVQFAAEINHRFAPFITDILKSSKHSPNYSFVLQLRDPIDLIRSRINNCTVWDQSNHNIYISKLPYFYQCDIFKNKGYDQFSNSDNNLYRPCQGDSDNIIDMHVQEITSTLDLILSQLIQLPQDRYVILNLSDRSRWVDLLRQILPPQAIDWKKFASLINVKHGTSKGTSNKTKAWADQLLTKHSANIRNSYNKVLIKHGIVDNSEFII